MSLDEVGAESLTKPLLFSLISVLQNLLVRICLFFFFFILLCTGCTTGYKCLLSVPRQRKTTSVPSLCSSGIKPIHQTKPRDISAERLGGLKTRASLLLLKELCCSVLCTVLFVYTLLPHFVSKLVTYKYKRNIWSPYRAVLSPSLGPALRVVCHYSAKIIVKWKFFYTQQEVKSIMTQNKISSSV